MNFDFSEDVTTMREEVRRVLQDRFPTGAVRQAVDAGQPCDRAFWQLLGEMGWIGIAVPEAYGGVGLGYEPLCMIAEEMGGALTTVPLASSIYLAAEALLLFGSEEQKTEWLPRLASGEIIGALAIAEGAGDPRVDAVRVRAEGDRLTGVKLPVVDGDLADIVIVAAREGDAVGLWLVDMNGAGVSREDLNTLDAVRKSVRLTLDGAAAERLPGAQDWAAIERLLERAAILVAFEQVGGAQAALDMAVGYAKDRYAFGRPIASFQAIKHKLADIYVATQLARSNAYYGAWALENDSAELPTAAAAARLAATDAFTLAAKENIQTHGGMGFTWESDCHLYYRRARELAIGLGSERYWRDRLIDGLSAGKAG
jgi:acyl-CoA dehydrogenase